MRRERPHGSFATGEEEFEVHRPLWRDPDLLDSNPVADEAWDVFKLDEESAAEPEPGDFWAPADDGQ